MNFGTTVEDEPTLGAFRKRTNDSRFTKVQTIGKFTELMNEIETGRQAMVKTAIPSGRVLLL